MSTTGNSTNGMTPNGHADGEALIAELQNVVEGHDPALASYAFGSVLATLVANHAAQPLAQARHIGRLLVDVVLSPPLNRLTY